MVLVSELRIKTPVPDSSATVYHISVLAALLVFIHSLSPSFPSTLPTAPHSVTPCLCPQLPHSLTPPLLLCLQLVLAELSGGSGRGTAAQLETPLSVELVETYRLRPQLKPRTVLLGRWRYDDGRGDRRGRMVHWVNGSIYERRQDWSGLELHITTVTVSTEQLLSETA